MITFDSSQVKRLSEVVGNSPKRLRKELAIAVNAAAKTAKSQMAKEVAKELVTPQKIIKTTISIATKATSAQRTPTSVVRLAKTRRLSLRDFGARQTTSGVTYRISKREGRKTARHAFQGPKPGVMKTSWKGHAFKRAGKARLPIIKLKGASPWGVYTGRRMSTPVVAYTQAELRKQVERRIRFLILKEQGTI